MQPVNIQPSRPLASGPCCLATLRCVHIPPVYCTACTANLQRYLGGVLDFTGELNRHAIQRATVRDRPAVQAARDLVDAIMGQFLQFDLRNR